MKSKLMVALLTLGLLMGGGVAPAFAAKDKSPTTQKTGNGKHKKHRRGHKKKHHKKHIKVNKKAHARKKAHKKNKAAKV